MKLVSAIALIGLAIGQISFASQSPGGKYLCSVSKYHKTIFNPIKDMSKPIDFSLPENQDAPNKLPPFGVAFAENAKYIIYVNETRPASDPYASQFVIYTVAKSQPQATVSMAMGYMLSGQTIDLIDGASNASVTCIKR